MTARLRLLSQYECAVLSALRLRAWWPWVGERDLFHGVQVIVRTPARTVRHHLERFTAAGLLAHDPARGWRWNSDADPTKVALIERAAMVEGLALAPVAYPMSVHRYTEDRARRVRPSPRWPTRPTVPKMRSLAPRLGNLSAAAGAST